MEEEDHKTCPNCKREIPSVNFTIHTVHCARNIRVCPVCKEPVLHAELQEHHDKLHKPVPCKKCGESVCGTDLEDHIRDSCGHTVKSCRFCELELPRRELPSHEGYCGVRTEQCAECREWVMIKYRQLHLDSNHGFLRLHDDPQPVPKIEPPRTIYKVQNTASTSNANKPKPTETPINGLIKNVNLNQNHPRTEIRYYDSSSNNGNVANAVPSGSGTQAKPTAKRTNDQPQINTDSANTNKVDKAFLPPPPRGAVKKRAAPQPPREPPPQDPRRDLPYASARRRQQDEERRREAQTAYNLAHGLPPVLSPAAKIEKLRKLDALQNPRADNEDYKNRLQGRVWMSDQTVAGHVLGSTSNAKNHGNGARNIERNDLMNLKPMTPEEFMDRFSELQLDENGRGNVRNDRFSEIKSSLRELRRGLNEVTAPYNANANAAPNQSSESNGRSRQRSPAPPAEGALLEDSDEAGDEVRLPCEFCGAPVPAHCLVQHQTGCRPDLAQLRPRSVSPSPTPSRPPPDPIEEPVIPCEFCTESLPVCFITEHQERCRRGEAYLLFPD